MNRHGCTLASETQPASTLRSCLAVAMGAGAKIVCASLQGYDHFSAIRSVSALVACLARDGGEFKGIIRF